MQVHIPFDNSYARLPERFYAPCEPTPVSAPSLVHLNVALAESLGLDPAELSGPDGVAVLAGNAVAPGSTPVALAYAGHQFGNFVPQLGDGRAILLGEVVGRDGLRRDIQLKGSGPTPFSRRGDGRAGLGPVLREYLVSEAMAALGVPTTRALAAVTTGDQVFRETVVPGAILTRVAASHIRVGTFQYFAARSDTGAIRILADTAIARHYPDLAAAPHPYRALLAAVLGRQAELVAQWLSIGFIHGVMNTDNTAISGETIDYGPCAFMDEYDPATVFSSIDQAGRYAYGNQPSIAQWNLVRLAEAMLPLLDPEQDTAIPIAQEILSTFGPVFDAAYLGRMRRKIGLATEQDTDAALIGDLLQRMAESSADFTNSFRNLADLGEDWLGDWPDRWRQRLAAEATTESDRRRAMDSVNPIYIPRNHTVEAALQAAIGRADYGPFSRLLDVVSSPYQQRPGLDRYAEPAKPEERVLATFCGT